jgi:hypothetical protein
VIVTTSNLAPDQLYRNGLNRQLFLPFIALIGASLEIVSLDSSTDYRLGRVKAHETFLTPLSPETDARLQDLWVRLTDTEKGSPRDIDVLGRKLHVPQAAGRAARFSGCARFFCPGTRLTSTSTHTETYSGSAAGKTQRARSQERQRRAYSLAELTTYRLFIPFGSGKGALGCACDAFNALSRTSFHFVRQQRRRANSGALNEPYRTGHKPFTKLFDLA